MSELMGISGASAEAIARTLDRLQSHIDRSGGLRVDRWEGEGLGLLRFHHGVINAQPQPVFNEDRSLLVAMDGEVFGCEGVRRELAQAGHRFRYVDNDAELVLHLYEHTGEAGFRRLTGSYSIVLYDLRARRLLLVTDRLFTRPIFYCSHRQALVFSSRFNALLACGAPQSPSLDMTAVMQFFTFQQAQYSSTFCRQAKAMLPASVLELADGQVSERKYWQLQYSAERGSERRFVDELTETLRASARRTTCDEARKGVMLSGGLDSRVLVAAAAREMVAYTVGDGFNREVRTARRVARARGWKHVFLKRPPDHYSNILAEAVELSGGMCRFDHCQFLGLLGPVRQECDVVFNEDAMDALFKGYYWSRRLSVRGVQVPAPVAGRFTTEGIEEQILRMGCKSMFPSSPWLLFRQPWRSRYRDILYASIREQIADGRTEDPYHMVEHVAGLASLGRALLNVSHVRPYLEYRSLSFDSDLLELAVRTPVRYRLSGGLLREALKRLDGRLYAIPYANTGMRMDTPAPIAWAFQMAGEVHLRALRKLGLVPPIHTNESWPDRAELLRIPPMRHILETVLQDPRAIEPSLFDTDRVGVMVREHMSRKRDHMRMLLCLLTFGHWSKRYGPRTVD